MRYYTRYSRGVGLCSEVTVLATAGKVTTQVMSIRGRAFAWQGVNMSPEEAADVVVNLLQDRERRASYEYWANNRRSDPSGWPEGMMRDQRPEIEEAEASEE